MKKLSRALRHFLQCIKAMKNTNSTGIDEIPINVIKATADFIAEPLSAVLNSCLSYGIFPESMKIAKVCPIFKSGTNSEFNNYRPISILTGFSKIFEKLIYNRLVNFIERHKILVSSQFGFRKNHSTYMALMSLYDKISQAIDSNEYCVGIFIDLSKAFDTINHNIL